MQTLPFCEHTNFTLFAHFSTAIFEDTREEGVDEKMTNYVDMGRGIQKFDLFCFKS